jgi:hypothetical protein
MPAPDERSKNMLDGRFLGRMSRSFTVLLTVAAWLCLSNHCALGLGTISSPASEESEAGACPMHPAPAKKKPAPNPPCCKDLRAIAVHALKNIGARAGQFAGVSDYAPAIFLTPPRRVIEINGLDTGPPGCFSFAELVLQKSLPSHAPPVS